MPPNETPDALVGLQLETRGFQEAEESAKRQLSTWQQMEGTVGRIAGHFGRIANYVTAMAGVGGVAAILSDYMKLEAVSNQAALGMGQVGGRNAYQQTIRAGRAAGLATSQDSQDLVLSMMYTQGAIGGRYFQNQPGRQTAFMTLMGRFANAYNMDPTQVGSLTGQFLAFQGQGASSAQGVLAGLANQAARGAGMGGSTGNFLQMVQGLAAQAVGSDIMNQRAGLLGTVGGFASALARSSTLYRDPSRVNEAFGAINSAVTGAYQNPRMSAWLQMAGVGYWDQRSGLGGRNGLDVAGRILSFSQRQYGTGTMQQDLFLRSNFGEAGANAFRALQKGNIKDFEKYQAQMDPQAAMNDTLKRSAQTQTTSLAELKAIKEKLGQGLDPILSQVSAILGILGGGGVLDKLGLGNDSVIEDLIYGYLGLRGGKAALGIGSRILGRGAGSAAARAGGGRAAGSLLSKIMPGVGGGAAASVAGGVAGAYLGFMVFPDSTAGPDMDSGEAVRRKGMASDIRGFKATMKGVQERFGDGWQSNPAAVAWAKRRIRGAFGNEDDGYYHVSKDVVQRFDQAIGGADKKFQESVDKFEKAVNKATGGGGNGNAAGLGASTTNQVGQAMLGSYLLGGGSPAGGGGSSGAPVGTGYSSGSGGGGIGNPTMGGAGGQRTGTPSGGGWKDCLLTYYAPSQGGINGRAGGGAAGVPLYDNTWACAAPPEYEFGTIIEFAYGGKSIKVPVLDRGGAITGSHFDLLVAPAKALGMYSHGKVNAKFRVAGKGPVQAGNPAAKSALRAGGGGGGGSSPTAHASSLMAGGGFPTSGGGGGGKGTDITINVDGRRLEKHRRVTRGM